MFVLGQVTSIGILTKSCLLGVLLENELNVNVWGYAFRKMVRVSINHSQVTYPRLTIKVNSKLNVQLDHLTKIN